MQMRTFWVLLMAAVTMASFAGPSFAQATIAGQPTQGNMAAPAKVVMPMAAKPHSLVGEVVAVDQTAKTVTIRFMVRGQPREATFTTKQQAAPRLANLKPGDRVRVGYHKEQGQLIAHSLVETYHKASQ
jgi:Cu/Ag efflux protein CusF